MKVTQEQFFYELTNPQKSIYFSEQFFDDPHIYVIPAWAEIKEKNIDFSILEQAINLTVKNHDAHRTRFIKQNDSIYQYFENYIPFDVPKITVNDIPELEAFIKDITFDIYSAAPIKFVMFENISSGFGGFCCILHHLIGDAWSLSLILEETLKCYNQLMNPEKTYEPRTSSYKSFIEQEAEYLTSDKFQKDKEYWEEKFHTPSEIFTFKNSENVFETNSKRLSFELPTNIKNFCTENKISMFSFFYTVIAVYFARILNMEEMIIGTPYLNRTNFREKNAMGMFISTLPFKQKIDFQMPVSKLIKEITISELGALRHQRYPYAELQKYYTAQFGRANNLYDILFSYQNAKADNQGLDFDFESKWVFTDHQVESIVISISDIDGKDVARIDYDFLTHIFSDEEIVKTNDRLLYLASQMMRNIDIPVKDLEIVTPAEKEILVDKLNDTLVPYDKNATIATLFSKAAKETPNGIALSFDGKSMTYQELEEKSNRLADVIKKAGAQRNEFVGILMNRSFEMIISILAVLKSGSAYMPINPDYPAERIDYMISDSNCRFLLTTEDLKYENDNVKKMIVKVDTSKKNNQEPNNQSSSPIANFENVNEPDDLAYVIYTSGSTGKPKGVMIKHSSIVNTLLWRKKAYHFDENFSVLQIPSFAFDSSVEDIFTPLIAGAKLVLIKQSNSHFDVPLMKQLIVSENINHMLVVPSFYNVLLSEIPEALQNFKAITVAGEGFSSELVKKHFSLLPHVPLFNEYGPTENSVCTTYHQIHQEEKEVYIGRPIDNCKCYILDSHLQLQPFHVKGELYVSGPGLAKGYIGRNDLTEDRFIPNPFFKNGLENNEDYAFMYKTGDIVSMNEDGFMQFHERTDYQVKYNGFRINLGEIESRISSLIKNPNVVVLLHKSENISKLCAYIETSESIDIPALKQELKKFLPHYMLPKQFQLVKKFPLTPNGKIDRKALAKVKLKETDTVIIAPRNKLDARILEAWKHVLNQENISIDDNIFELGGDSLSIISIQSFLFQHKITVNSQALFENQTIRSISDFIAKNRKQTEEEQEEIFSPAKTSLEDLNHKSNMPHSILLTGSTGFLGSHILAELMNQYDNIRVYCLVRSKPEKNYRDRFQDVLHYYFGNKYDLLIDTRIFPIEGDLVREHLGMDITLYKNLISEIDCIVNAASLVKHFGDYHLFYNSNVLSAKNLIRFAKEANASIQHISTTSVSGNYLVKNDITYDYTENDFYIGQNYKDNVYVRTKFEAENEMFEAQKEGVSVNVFRVGNLMQRLEDGMFQMNQFDNAYFKRIYGFIKIKKLPKNLITQKLEFTPVDSCARAIVLLMPYQNKVFHLLNPNTINISDLTAELSNSGIAIDFVSPEAFNKFIHSDISEEYLESFITDFNHSNRLNYETKITINDSITEEYLHKNGFYWPMITKDYIQRFIALEMKQENER
ncbi:MAG: amino acid adenylation domain-containing protein [Clostridia bacterium]|nr:amino acid adenylation domain-containing protein [Clostridia bacterium]